MQIVMSKLEQCTNEKSESLHTDLKGAKKYDGDCCANVCQRCPISLSKVNFISWSLFFNWHKMQVPGMRIGCYLKGRGCFILMFYWWNSAVPVTGTASGDSLVKLALSSKDPLASLFSGLKSSKVKGMMWAVAKVLFSTESHKLLLTFLFCN